MLRRITERLDFTRRLGFRLGALLSVAILPIGLISLVQNLHLSRQAERNAEIALLGRTASAAAGERSLLQSAFGSAEALGPAILETASDPTACADLLRQFIQRSATYVSATFVPMNGVATCSSSLEPGASIDLTQSPVYLQFLAAPATRVTAVSYGMISHQPIVVVSHPLYRGEDLLGYTTVSLSQDLLRSTHTTGFGTEGARIITFNSVGEVLTSDSLLDGSAIDLLPRDIALPDLAQRSGSSFRMVANNGERRVFTVVPVIPTLVYAVGSWSPKVAGMGAFQLSKVGAVMLPIALWAVSLAVAYLAVFRLVLRHISVLRGQMRRFAIGARDNAPPVLQGAPTEITDVSQTFHNMARILIRDEETMGRAVAEKTVLLKEVHHRVKNNLQLIASIINMQGRLIDDPDAKRVLRSVQDRVSALATIYRNLYQAEQLDAVQVHMLLTDIIGQLSSAAASGGRVIRVEAEIEPMEMLPDQAVPLTLLATEALTNALKYAAPADATDETWVRVVMRITGFGRGFFEVTNSVSTARDAVQGTGLGSQLIEAFSTQLEAHVEQGFEADHYRIAISFDVIPPGVMASPEARKVVLTSEARSGAQH